VAVDPSVVKLQTHLVIDGYDIEFVARDTGSGVNGKHVDIFMPVSHSEALKMDQGNKRKVWRVVQ
jgi:3D (Asp-Asp-Asp) domain-containing protein